MRVKQSFRTADLARAVGISAQMVRNYEQWGIIPAAARSPAGHRLYQQRHLQALQAARRMMAGYGWKHAVQLLRWVYQGALDQALALVDARHAELHRSRQETEQTITLLREIATALPGQEWPRQAGRSSRPLPIGAAARQVGVRVSTLRFWESQGLLQPRRDPLSRYRCYDEEQLRRLQIITLLRKAGYGFAAIRGVLQQLAAGRPEEALQAAENRLRELVEASRHCAAATAAFYELLVSGFWLRAHNEKRS